jgi:hypothetical protein
MSHKFILGQGVGYTPHDGLSAPSGLYIVIEKLPERDDEFEYCIRHFVEKREFIAKESELRWVEA